MAYTKNATVDSWDTNKQLEYYKANPNEAKQEIARAQGVGGSAASSWASQLQGLSSDPRAASGSASTVPTTITSRPTASNGGGSSILRDAYESRSTTNGGNAWNGYNPIGAASAPSAYVAQANKNTSSYNAPASSYTGSASVIGNVSGSQDLGKSYQDILNANRTGDQQYKQLNTWADNKGNVYDTTKMTAQQIFAMGLSKDNNPNAAAILKGMGLDMNGNPTSPMPTFSFGGSGGGGGLSSDPRVSLSSVYADSKATQSGSTSTGYTKNPTVDALPLQQQLDYYRQHPEEAQQEILRSMQVYNGASTDAQRNGAHSWADMLRQAAGISDSNATFGNNNGLTPAQQQANIDLFMKSLNSTGLETGADGTGSGTTGTGTVGTGTGAAGGGKVDPLNIYDRIYQMFQNRLDATKQENKFAQDQSLALLANQDNVINQNAISDLNANDVTANKRLQMFKEAAAAAGLSSSGDNISGQLAIGTDQQQGINSINTNKTNKLSDLMATRSAITNNATANDLAAMKQLWAERDGLLINQGNADRTFNYNAGQDAINNARQSKVDNWNAYMDSVGLTGNLGTGAKADWGLLGGTNGEWTLDAKVKLLQQEGIKVNNELAKIQLADYPAEQKLKMQQLQKQIAEIGKAPYQSAVDIEYDKIKLDTAKEQLKQLQDGKALKDTDIADMIDKSPLVKKQYDPETNRLIGTTVEENDKPALMQYIKSLPGMTADKAMPWFIKYGLYSGN